MAARTVQLGYTDEWLMRVFHSEFSSVLLWRHPEAFDTSAWKACNAPDFKYGNDGVNAIKGGTASTKYTPEAWKEGFINQYAKASVEEDFNGIVEYLFLHKQGDRPALAASKGLAQKAALVTKFYRNLGMDINAPDGAIALK